MFSDGPRRETTERLRISRYRFSWAALTAKRRTRSENMNITVRTVGKLCVMIRRTPYDSYQIGAAKKETRMRLFFYDSEPVPQKNAAHAGSYFTGLISSILSIVNPVRNLEYMSGIIRYAIGVISVFPFMGLTSRFAFTPLML